eukprot:14336518-Alexandrium_andersonii.AAC.1
MPWPPAAASFDLQYSELRRPWLLAAPLYGRSLRPPPGRGQAQRSQGRPGYALAQSGQASWAVIPSLPLRPGEA